MLLSLIFLLLLLLDDSVQKAVACIRSLCDVIRVTKIARRKSVNYSPKVIE